MAGEQSIITLTVAYGEDNVTQVTVGPDADIEYVMNCLQMMTDVPPEEQTLVFEGRELAASAKVAQSGLKDGEVLMMVRRPRQQAGASGGGGGGPAAAAASSGAGSRNDMAAAMRLNPTTGEAENPQAFIECVKSIPELMSQMQQNPALGRAIVSGDVAELQSYLRAVFNHRKIATEQAQREAQLATADPFDIDAQREIEKRIMQSNVEENFQSAMEHNPESFGRVIMLYIDVVVNGFPLKAFVDSGAQSTIMSDSCARACNLSRLIDDRFKGVAMGVGTGTILGRVHQAPMTIAGTHFPCTFTILENQSVDLLLGLDMLKRFQCCIDLERNELRLGGSGAGTLAVKFLSEAELPESARERSEAKPEG